MTSIKRQRAIDDMLYFLIIREPVDPVAMDIFMLRKKKDNIMKFDHNAVAQSGLYIFAHSVIQYVSKLRPAGGCHVSGADLKIAYR
tara:strand:- start:1606 stop:1863 length:258 start_codon:yes stop_codon:yes gene_type:complete